MIGFITFIASTISNVSPALTVSPTPMNGLPPGSADRKAVPTIGDLTGVPAIGSARRGRFGGFGRCAPGLPTAALVRRPARKDRGRLAAHLDLPVAVLDLDLGQFIVGEQGRELADQLRIDPHAVALIALGRVRHDLIPY